MKSQHGILMKSLCNLHSNFTYIPYGTVGAGGRAGACGRGHGRFRVRFSRRPSVHRRELRGRAPTGRGTCTSHHTLKVNSFVFYFSLFFSMAVLRARRMRWRPRLFRRSPARTPGRLPAPMHVQV